MPGIMREPWCLRPTRRMPWPRVSVVVATLNEARNLPYVFARLPAGIHEVILVDGHSGTTPSRSPAAASRRPVVDADPPRQRQRARLRLRRRTGDSSRWSTPTAPPTRPNPAFVQRWSPAPTSPRAPVRPGRRQRRHHPPAPRGNRALGTLRQLVLRHPLHRPVLRLQRVLAAARPGARPGRRPPPPPTARPAVGRRLRGRNPDPPPRRRRRAHVTEVPSFEHPASTARATSTPSATACASCPPPH